MRPDVTEKFERSLRSDSTKQMPGEEQLVPMGGGGGGGYFYGGKGLLYSFHVVRTSMMFHKALTVGVQHFS